jgi:hypothetical protein
MSLPNDPDCGRIFVERKREKVRIISQQNVEIKTAQIQRLGKRLNPQNIRAAR